MSHVAAHQWVRVRASLFLGQMSGRKKVPLPPQMRELEFGWAVHRTTLLQQFQLLIFREMTS
jgi:hypothetical protein